MISQEILTTLGIDSPNPMQKQAWEARESKLIIISPTGSGKTLAFIGAVIGRLAPAGSGPQAVIIAPSRELVMQIAEILRRVAIGYKTMAMYGSHAMLDETRSVQASPDIIVATPGRLLDHLQRGSLNISRLTSLVIDEYDKCLEMGFHDEMRRIVRRLPRPANIILTSATVIDAMPDFIDMSGARTIINKADRPRTRIDIARVESPARDKLDTLVALLRDLGDTKSIVFVNHRESAERIFDRLRSEGLPAGLYHGGLEQDLRDRAIVMLNNGSTPILVSTDLGSRGLDIDRIDNVIHYHLPPTEAAWTHRNGRTARVDASGRVFIITSEGENIPEYVNWDHDFTPSHDAAPTAKRPALVTMHINAGRREKVSRGDIVGFLTKQAGLDGAQIGRIDLRDHSAYVAVPRSALPLIAAVPAPKIKNKRVRITPVQP